MKLRIHNSLLLQDHRSDDFVINRVMVFLDETYIRLYSNLYSSTSFVDFYCEEKEFAPTEHFGNEIVGADLSWYEKLHLREV